MRCLQNERILAGIVSAAGIAACAASARASISATAEVSTSQTSSPFNYTVTLHNTGNTTIGTFWFAWTLTPREYNFLPTTPTGLSQPSGWVAPISHGGTPGDLYGIEWFNSSGLAIPMGGTGIFHFTSRDSPQTLLGPAWFPGFVVTHSLVYIGVPEGDPGYAFDATVSTTPAPGGAIAVGGLAALFAGRRRRR